MSMHLSSLKRRHGKNRGDASEEYRGEVQTRVEGLLPQVKGQDVTFPEPGPPTPEGMVEKSLMRV